MKKKLYQNENNLSELLMEMAMILNNDKGIIDQQEKLSYIVNFNHEDKIKQNKLKQFANLYIYNSFEDTVFHYNEQTINYLILLTEGLLITNDSVDALELILIHLSGEKIKEFSKTIEIINNNNIIDFVLDKSDDQVLQIGLLDRIMLEEKTKITSADNFMKRTEKLDIEEIYEQEEIFNIRYFVEEVIRTK